MSAVLNTVRRAGAAIGAAIGGRVSKTSINSMRQNRPTLIARDLAPWLSQDAVYETLLQRGVFKWLAVRRQLIALKYVWRRRVTESITRQHELSAMQHSLRGRQGYERERAKLLRKMHEERGYRRGIEQARAEIRALCHSDRWQAPDNDRAAQRWLAKRSEA